MNGSQRSFTWVVIAALIGVWIPGSFAADQADAIAAKEPAGIGVALRQDGDFPAVRSILADSAAAASKSIAVGDRIIAVTQADGTEVLLKGYKIGDAAPLIRGAKGTTVRLTIVKPGEDESQAHVVSLVRGELKLRWGDGVRLLPGAQAPDIQMVDLATGGSEKLGDYAGKILVVEFWASWCGPCQRAVAELQDAVAAHPEWKDKVVFITATLDEDKETAIQHLKKKGWDKTHNTWVDVPAIKAFHIDGIPTAYVIDAQGKIVEAAERTGLVEAVERLLEEQ